MRQMRIAAAKEFITSCGYDYRFLMKSLAWMHLRWNDVVNFYLVVDFYLHLFVFYRVVASRCLSCLWWGFERWGWRPNARCVLFILLHMLCDDVNDERAWGRPDAFDPEIVRCHKRRGCQMLGKRQCNALHCCWFLSLDFSVCCSGRRTTCCWRCLSTSSEMAQQLTVILLFLLLDWAAAWRRLL